MTWITVPASNFQLASNSLKLWNAGSDPGVIKSIRITQSAEAGQLKEAFAVDGALIGTGESGANIISAIAAERASLQIITDMADGGRLDPSEKRTWQTSWISITAAYDKVVAYAVSLTVSITAIVDAYENLLTLLQSYTVWTAPEITVAINGTTMAYTYQAYANAYRDLSDACTDQVALNAELAAVDTSKLFIGTRDADDALSDLDVAKLNGVAANEQVLAMVEDDELSVIEKKTWRDNWDVLASNYVGHNIRANRLEIPTLIAPVLAAKNTLYAYLVVVGVWLRTNVKEAVNGTTMLTNTAAYYDALEKFLEDCATREGELATEESALWIGDRPADDTLTDLDTAKNNGETVIAVVATMSDNDELSIDEKQTWRRTWPSLVSNYNIYVTKANDLIVSTAALDTAATALYNYLTAVGVWSRTDTSDAITGSGMEDKVIAYYDAVEDLLIACNKKETESWSKEGADQTQLVLNAGAELEDAYLKGESLISGDYIRANLINANAIIVGNPVFDSEVEDLIASNPTDGPLALLWKQPGTTLIQGGNIYTGSITTNQIYSGSIETNKIKADNIYAGTIDADKITADHIKAGTITADKIHVGTITADNIVTDANLDGHRIGVSSGTLPLNGAPDGQIAYTGVTHNIGRIPLVSHNGNPADVWISSLTTTNITFANKGGYGITLTISWI